MQTTYTLHPDQWQVGQIADTSDRTIDSYLAEGAVGIAKCVIRGTDKSRQVIQASTSAGQAALVIGVSVNGRNIEQTDAGLVQYKDKSAVSVMTRGRVIVETDDAVVAGAVANLKLSSGKFTDEAVAAGIEAFTQISVRFLTGTTAAGLAEVEIK